MDERRLTDTECALYGTKSCALLNMPDCEKCPLKGRIADPAIHDDLRLFCNLQPEGSIAQLFESETCTLCKEEPKGKPSCFAVFDMAHTEPKKLATRKWLSKNETGFMVPLQFACCSKCRRRILLSSYLPLITPIVLLLITLPLVLPEHMAQGLRKVAMWLPLAIVAFAIIGGYAIGKVLSVLYRRKCESSMYVDVRTHPFVDAMTEKGWRPLFNDRQAHIAFTKKRIDKGLGSAPGTVYEMPDWKENGAENEISD
ncbi:MAG: hypothetical protein II117_00630 [Clostridia bacterium]|nr:hypothetical protein [Clostridia bacterium]